MDTAALIKSARHDAGMSQGQLAQRAGITRSVLTRYERGTNLPSIGTLRRILAAAGKQIHAELEPLDADIRHAITELATTPLEDRPAVVTWSLISGISQITHRVEGLAAAAILGAPIPVTDFELALADEPETFAWLHRGLHAFTTRFSTPERSSTNLHHLNPEQLRDVITQDCADGTFDLAVVAFSGPATLKPPSEIANHVQVNTTYGIIPVQPLHDVEASDPQAARVLAVLRGEPPTNDAAPPGTALTEAATTDVASLLGIEPDYFWPD